MSEGIGRYGMLRFVPNDEIDRMKAAEEPAEQPQQFVSGLAAHLQSRWQAAKRAKEDIQIILLKCLRQRDGKYSAEKLANIQASGMSEVFMHLTDIKSRALESWIKDIMTPPGERPFNIEPTPIVDLPPEVDARISQEIYANIEQIAMANWNMANEISWDEVEKEAQESAINMLNDQAKEDADDLTREIDDDLVEGGWYEALDEFAFDISTYPAAFLDGPLQRNKPVLAWQQTENGSTPSVEYKVVKEYERVSPFDVFPSPGAKSLNDGYYFVRERLRRSDFSSMIGVEGYDDEKIRQVLREFGSGYKLNVSSDQEQSVLEFRPLEFEDPEGVIEVLKFCGPIRGQELVEWGVEGIEDPEMDYEVKAYMVGHIVFSAVLNPHPLGHRTLRSASFKKSNDSIWGQGPPQIMSDIQDICNACARAMVNNMGMASGPQVWAWANLLDPSKPITTLKPWDIHFFNADETSQMGSREPMGFFQPDPIIDALLKIFDYFYKLASEVTGIPAYIYGEDTVRGAGKTASGLSMLMNAASKGLKMVIGHIDKGVIKPSIYDHWVHKMLNESGMAKGDINVRPRASEHLIMMEQLQIRRMEWLNVTNNPTDMQIIGLEGRAEVLKESAKALKMPVDRIVPDQKTIEDRMRKAQIQNMIQNIAAETGLPAEQLFAIASGQQQPTQTAPDGGQQGGRDFALQ